MKTSRITCFALRVAGSALLSIFLLLSGCPFDNLDNDIDAAVDTLGRASDKIDEFSKTWEDVARGLIPKLKDAGYELIANDLQQLADRTLMTANIKVECTVEYVRRRTKQILQSIKSAIDIHKNDSQEAKAKLEMIFPPFICQADPPYINLYGVTSTHPTVMINGFDLKNQAPDGSGLKVIYVLADRNQTKVDQSPSLSISSFAEAILNVSATGAPVDDQVHEIQLQWNGQILSSIPVVGPVRETKTIQAQLLPEFRPNHRGGGGRKFDDDPIIKCKCTLETHVDTNNLDTVVANVYMKAVGTKDNPPVAAEGSEDFPLPFTVQPGQHVRRYISASSDQIDHAFTMKDQPLDWDPADLSKGLDQFLNAIPSNASGNFLKQTFQTDRPQLLADLTASMTHQGLVKTWRVWGRQDKGGADVEVYTGVQVELNPIVVEVEGDASEDSDKAKASASAHAMIESQLSSTLPAQVRAH
jgi:hypothetical protein